MNILVTGGAGYIGSHLVDRFLKRKDRVFIIDNLSTGNIKNIAHNLDNPDCTFVNDSILNEELVDRIVPKVDMIYHMAATVGVKHVVEDPLKGVITNVQGSEIMMKTAFKYWKRILIASTSEVYGKTNKFPFSEDDDRVLGSTSVHRWSYSTAKAIDEHIAFAYADKGLPVSIVRYFNSFGPRIDERGYGSVVAQFIRQCFSDQPLSVHGDGKQSRCFTFIDDTIEGTVRVGEKKDALGKCFNIGTTVETTIAELAKTVISLTKSKSSVEHLSYEQVFGKGFEDTSRRVPSMKKAAKYLEWQPSVSLEEGLLKTIEWCKKNYEGRMSGSDGFAVS